MTLTARSMEWLMQNRKRAYPLERSEWREKVSPESGLDALLVDASVFDPDADGGERLSLESVDIAENETTIRMKYADTPFAMKLNGGEDSGQESFACYRGIIRGRGSVGVSASFIFSSHAYLIRTVGLGEWTFGCGLLKSRIVTLSDGTGVRGIATNGSSGVTAHEQPSMLSGDIVLEDGYRTSPIVYNGRVFVRVGKRYGLDPCKYDFGARGVRDCKSPLFFFCGQNAVNSGNVIIKGGRGISVTQGGTYLVDDTKSKCNGRRIPCIEIVAGKELLDISRPSSDSK